MEIKAAVVFEKSGKFSIEPLEMSDPNDDEVLVRIIGTGICHTDIAGRWAATYSTLFSCWVNPG